MAAGRRNRIPPPRLFCLGRRSPDPAAIRSLSCRTLDTSVSIYVQIDTRAVRAPPRESARERGSELYCDGEWNAQRLERGVNRLERHIGAGRPGWNGAGGRWAVSVVYGWRRAAARDARAGMGHGHARRREGDRLDPGQRGGRRFGQRPLDGQAARADRWRAFYLDDQGRQHR